MEFGGGFGGLAWALHMSANGVGGATGSLGSAGSRLAWVTPTLVVLVDSRGVDSGGAKNTDGGASQYVS